MELKRNSRFHLLSPIKNTLLQQQSKTRLDVEERMMIRLKGYKNGIMHRLINYSSLKMESKSMMVVTRAYLKTTALADTCTRVTVLTIITTVNSSIIANISR